MQIGREKLNAEQGALDLGLEEKAGTQAVVRSTRSGILINAIRTSYAALGFDEAINDEAFFQMVLARLVEPTSKARWGASGEGTGNGRPPPQLSAGQS